MRRGGLRLPLEDSWDLAFLTEIDFKFFCLLREVHSRQAGRLPSCHWVFRQKPPLWGLWGKRLPFGESDQGPLSPFHIRYSRWLFLCRGPFGNVRVGGAEIYLLKWRLIQA